MNAHGKDVVGNLHGQMSWPDTTGNIPDQNLSSAIYASGNSLEVIICRYTWSDIDRIAGNFSINSDAGQTKQILDLQFPVWEFSNIYYSHA